VSVQQLHSPRHERPRLVVVPGRYPSSTSACTTQFLRVSGLIPSCSPTRRNVPDLVDGSRHALTAILVALSRSSSGYFLGAAMLLILPWIQSLHQTRGDSRSVVVVNSHSVHDSSSGSTHTDHLTRPG